MEYTIYVRSLIEGYATFSVRYGIVEADKAVGRMRTDHKGRMLSFTAFADAVVVPTESTLKELEKGILKGSFFLNYIRVKQRS